MIRTISALLAFGLLSHLAHAEPVSIFGLPLGGKPSTPIASCKDADIGNQTKLCFVGKPFVSKDGGKVGSLQIPEAALPEWSAYSDHKISIEKDGSISTISVSAKEKNLIDIIGSISKRFGHPTEAKLLDTRIPEATWDLPQIYIHVTQWGDRCCDVAFWTPAAIAAHRQYLEKSKIKRPDTP